MERGKAKKIQEKMLKINKRKPTPKEIDKLWDSLEECGIAEKKEQSDKKIATPPEVGL